MSRLWYDHRCGFQRRFGRGYHSAIRRHCKKTAIKEGRKQKAVLKAILTSTRRLLYYKVTDG